MGRSMYFMLRFRLVFKRVFDKEFSLNVFRWKIKTIKVIFQVEESDEF